jgi:chromosome segregation ATPase
VAEQDRRGSSKAQLSNALASINATVLNELASEVTRLRARIASLEAQLWRSPGEPDETDRALMEGPAGTLRNLHHCQALLAEARAEIATLMQENQSIRTQHVELAEIAAKLVDHNRLLTEAAMERARQLQGQTAKLTQAHLELATIIPENKRLRGEHAFYARRAAELEQHNRLITEAATERAAKLHECEGKLAQALTDAAIQARENEKMRVQHALHAQRIAELQEHNRLLTASATENAAKLHERDAELTKALVEIATLSPENKRLQGEHAFYARRAAEFEQHNRLLTEAATERAIKLQHCEAKLTRVEAELAAAARENHRMRAELARLTPRSRARGS